MWRSISTGTILVLADFVYKGSTNPDVRFRVDDGVCPWSSPPSQFVYARLVDEGYVDVFFFSGRVSHAAFVVLKPFTEDVIRPFDIKYVAMRAGYAMRC